MRTVGKTLTVFAVFFLSAVSMSAQNSTTVSGTVKDSNGVPYSNSTVQAQLLPVGATPTIPPPCNGQNATPCVVSAFSRGSTDAAGNFTMNLASNAVLSPGGTQWQFTVNTSGAPPPLGTGPQTCTATLTISGASQSVSASFSACPALGNGGALVIAVTPTVNAIYASPSCPSPTPPNCFQVFNDVKVTTDAIYTAGSTTVGTQVTDPAFVAGSEEGKIAFGTFNCPGTVSNCVDNCPQTTISSVTDAHHVVVGIACTNNSSAAPHTNNWFWGHDDGATLVSAFSVVVNGSTGASSRQNLFLPCGMMFTSVPAFIVPPGIRNINGGISGCGGGGATVVVPLPKMNCNTTGACLFADNTAPLESPGANLPGWVLRNITFWGGGTDVKDASATYSNPAVGISIQLFDQLDGVYVIGWVWNNGTPVFGIKSQGGQMINSGSVAGGLNPCQLLGNVGVNASMLGGTCGGSAGPSMTLSPAIAGVANAGVSTRGVYFNQSFGFAGPPQGFNVFQNGAIWYGSGDSVIGPMDLVSGTTYLTGTSIAQAGAGNSVMTISGGALHLTGVNISASGPAINQSGGTIFDDCGNGALPGAAPTITSLAGDCSITGVADVAGNHALTSGWGTANVNTLGGFTRDVSFTISVTGGTPAAGPVLTDAFASPFWATPGAGCFLIQTGGTFGVLSNPVPSAVSKTGVTWTFTGTPVSGQSYTFKRHCGNG